MYHSLQRDLQDRRDQQKSSHLCDPAGLQETRKGPQPVRPSAEALCRRIVKGQELYQIDTLVDLINLVSLKTGYSIGGFDLDKIEGDLLLGVGKAGERCEAIPRSSAGGSHLCLSLLAMSDPALSTGDIPTMPPARRWGYPTDEQSPLTGPPRRCFTRHDANGSAQKKQEPTAR